MLLLSTLSATRARKTLLAALSATVVATGIGAPTSASALVLPCWKTGTCKGGFHPGFAAAALAGGFIFGAMAAGAVNGGGSCVIERRRTIDEDGNVFFRNVRLCD